jgi:ribosomal protein S14
MKKGSDLTLMRYTKANDACFVVKPSLLKEQELHKTSHVKRIAGERSIMRKFNLCRSDLLRELDMSGIVFSEWVPAGSLAKAIVAFVSLVIFSVLSITIITGVAFQNPFWISVSVSVLAFLLLLFWNYRGMRIQVSEERLSVGYGLFNRKIIQLSDMVSCEPTKASFRKYGGVGIRLGLDGSWAYTTSLGHAVRIKRMSGRPFVFSTSAPEEVCNIVNQMRARRST